MTLHELSRLASLGEGRSLEFKHKVPRPERIAKEIIAFANTHGGQLLLGVDDNGAILGVRDANEEEFALDEALKMHCEPPVAIRIEKIAVTNNREVLVVQVPESEAKPHYLILENSRCAYVRVDDMSVEASREKVRLMKSEHTHANVKFEFGDKELMLMRYLEQYGRITVTQFAKMAHLPRRRASQTLVLLARARIVILHSTGNEDYFTLAYQKL